MHPTRPLPGRAARLASIVALAGATLAGCAHVARARAAQAPESAIPGERTPAAAELGLARSGPVRLAPLVAAALAAHPSVVSARRNVEAACARVHAAEGATRPSVTADASASVRDASGSSGAATEHRFVSFGFDVSWLLFDFGQRRSLARQAAEQWLAAQHDLRAAEVDAAFAVRSAYFELAKDLDLLATARETVAQFEARLVQVTEFERAGTRIAYDVTKARVDLGNARLLEVLARDAVETARATLGAAVGLAEPVEWTADPSEAPVPEGTVPAQFDAAWRRTLPSRPALAAAAAREQAASALIDARVAALYPSLSLGASASRAGSSTPLPWTLDLGPSVRWTPFDGFQNLAAVDESIASLKASRAARALEEQRAWLDVRTAFVAIEDATKRIGLGELQVRSAVENLELAQGRFQAGIGTSVDLSDAQQALASARTGLITARADRAIAVARAARAIGLVASN